jgi:hypothetical protein
MYHGETPAYLTLLLPNSRNAYSLRNAYDIPTPHCRTTLFQNSFIPSTTREWNKIPLDARNKSTAAFQSYLNSGLTKYSKLYNVGSRKGQIFHARLRLCCSSLNTHLFRRNLVPSPNCECEHFETPEHY